jgi:hypothetical protein
MSAQPAPKLTNSLKVWRAKLDEPPASGNIVVASAYEKAVITNSRPVSMKTSGVRPSAYRATTPRA